MSAQVIKRSQGRSAISAAAYRAGQRLEDENSGRVFDYGRKRGVAYSAILLPTGAAKFLGDRKRLWNYVEQIETRRDAQLAREINLALPCELCAEDRKALLLGFVWEQFVRRGMVADVAIHEPVAERGDDPRNFHAHVMLTLRRATATGLLGVKTREWNSEELLEKWREAWASHQNRALDRAGVRERVDHRKLVVQRRTAVDRRDRIAEMALDRLPGVHVGPRPRRFGRPPMSKGLVAGPFRIRKSGGKPERRLVLYQEIDRGSRAEHNAKISRFNLHHLIWKIVNMQQRLPRSRLEPRRLHLLGSLNERELARLARLCGYRKQSLVREVLRALKSAGRLQKRLSVADVLFTATAPRRAGSSLALRARGVWSGGRRRARRPNGSSIA